MTPIRVGIAGLGAIGRVLARRLADGVPGLALACISARDAAKAKAWRDAQRIACPVVALGEIPERADLVVECAPPEILEQVCRPMLDAGKRVMVLSCGALLARPDLDRACQSRAAARSSCRPARCLASMPSPRRRRGPFTPCA